MGTARTLVAVTALGLAPLLAGCGGQGSGASSATAAATSAAASAAPTTYTATPAATDATSSTDGATPDTMSRDAATSTTVPTTTATVSTAAARTPSATAPARTADAGGPASVVTGITEFASPSGNVLCSLSDQGATCSADAVSFTAPPDTGCDGWWGHTISLGAGAPAGFMCKQDAWAANDSKPSWWTPGTDSTVASMGWASAPALGYGHRLRNGATTCEVKRASGVTCTNGGHGFSLAKQSYRVW